MNKDIIQKIDNFHYNKDDLIVIYYTLGELPIEETGNIVQFACDRLADKYPDAEIIGLPVNIVPEVTTVSANDPMNSILKGYNKLLREKSLKSWEDTPTVKFDDADDDLWNI